jgi:hypothetical protein
MFGKQFMAHKARAKVQGFKPLTASQFARLVKKIRFGY